MLKNKSVDYLFGMITGIAVTITFWACTHNPLNADSSMSSSRKYQAYYGGNGSRVIDTATGQLYIFGSTNDS